MSEEDKKTTFNTLDVQYISSYQSFILNKTIKNPELTGFINKYFTK
jgi:hypothetical protein